MTSETNSTLTPTVAAGSRRLRPFLKAVLASVIALLGVGVFASPAFGHSNSVTGVASCPTGATQTITWTIANDYTLAETATDFTTSAAGSVSFSPPSVNIALTPANTSPANYSTGTVTETLPATDTGVVSFTETATWTDGHVQTVTGNATVGGGCTAPDIVVTKSVNTSTANNTVAAGSTTPVTYTLAITNNKQEPTTSTLTVTDAIPANTTYVALSASCGSTPSCSAVESAGTVTWKIQAPIYGGVTDDVSFQVTVNATAPSGTIPNTAGYSAPCTSAPGAPAPVAPAACSTNTVLITVTNTPVIIVVTKTANVTSVTAGQVAPVVYTLTVANPATSSTATQSDVTVTDVVPSGLTFVSASCGALDPSSSPSCTSTYDASTGTVSYTLGTGIAPGASYPVTFEATVNANDTATIVNSAGFTGPGCTTAGGCSTNKVSITVANFSVTKSDSAGSASVDPGDVVAYTLAVDNVGTGPGSITVNDAAPTGTSLTTPTAACPANSTPATCTVSVSGSSISWVLANLPAGTTYDLTFAVKVNPGTGGTHILNTGVYTEPGCTTAGGCSTNTTDNPVPPPTSSSTPTTTTTTNPTTTVKTDANGSAIKDASSVHTGEPWAGSTPYVLLVLGAGLSLFGLGQVRRRRAAQANRA